MAANANAFSSKHLSVFEVFDAFYDGVINVAGDGDDEVTVADFVFDLLAVVAGDAVGRNVNAALEAVLLEFGADFAVGGFVSANEGEGDVGKVDGGRRGVGDWGSGGLASVWKGGEGGFGAVGAEVKLVFEVGNFTEECAVFVLDFGVFGFAALEAFLQVLVFFGEKFGVGVGEVDQIFEVLFVLVKMLNEVVFCDF